MIRKQEKDILLSWDFFPQIGGAHTWMYEVYKRWPKEVITLANDYSNDPYSGKRQAEFDAGDHGALSIVRHPLVMEDISFFKIGCIGQYWNILWKISGLIQRQRGRLHCLRAFPEGIAATLYKTFFNRQCQLVTYVHGEELNVAATSRQLSIYTRQVLKYSDLVIANSRATLKKIHAFAPGIGSWVIIPPGVEWTAFQVSEKQIQHQRKRWGFCNGETILTTVSRLEPRKNHKMVIKAVARLIKSGMPLRYVIASDGEERSQLELLATTLGIREQVLFTGTLDEMQKILTFASADIHIMPSIRIGPMVEGYGIVFIEAAAAGIPSIAGNSGGQPEAVRQGKTGLVVDGNREEEVIGAIRKLVKNPDLRAKMACSGREWAMTHDWEGIAAKTWDTIVGVRG